jgi:uncharacterized protein YbaA (DUF1428 family)
MHYVDGFVIPVPKKKPAAYLRMARKAAKIFKEYGALEDCECAADDFRLPMGGVPFDRIARAKKDETVVFAWIVYKSKAHRDRVNKKIMNDPRMAQMSEPMPFDMKRAAYGGFKVKVHAH